jgi:Leucine-rich repeat (LRR) protein
MLIDMKMHANKLSTLPPKFNTFAFLRTLNLSKNNLSSEVLDCITQISTLIELYLSHNEIEGPLTSDISALENLQILDMDGNKITSIPQEIGKLRRMRTLLVAENQLTSIPWASLEILNDLNQLDISSNKLSGDLLPSSLPSITLSSLSNFDIHSNTLESLPSNLILPSLTQFNATQNALTTTGTFFTTTPRLCHLSLSQNQLPSLPDGVVHLQYLRTLDISNNIIEHIDPRLGLLDDLTTFMWLGNLIRQRNWGSMDTEGIKSALRAKADEAVLKGIEEEIALMNVNTCHGECGGVMDLSQKLKDKDGLSEEEVVRHVHAGHFPVVSKVVLQSNALTRVPREVGLITTLTTLDLSRNFLTGRLWEEPITLENLTHLDISVNKLDNLVPLPSVLNAPNLTSLDISYNSLPSLIALHTHYPNLITLYANSNQLTSLIPSDLQGLEIVQVNNNDINRLPPELALVESLRVLGVDGNTFRVPGRRVVEQGSAALLEWLRGRCVT